MTEQAAFKRIHVLPRRYGRYGERGDFFTQLCFESPRQRYIRQKSMERHLTRPDAYIAKGPYPAEVGTYEGFRFITSPQQ